MIRHPRDFERPGRPPTAKTAPALVAESVAARQHRRLTRRQHNDRYALPPGASVRVEIRGGDAVRRWVGRGATHRPGARGTLA